MIEKVKIVYYCEFCKRHRLTKQSIKDHEVRCTLNPNRICGWHQNQKYSIKNLVYNIDITWSTLNGATIAYLTTNLDGCPACMLACLRQSKFKDNYHDFFDYDVTVEKYRINERN